jgi:hypothetical protein
VSGAIGWPPPGVTGWRWVESTTDHGFRDGAFLPDATLATAEAVVASIPVGGSLQFYDWLYRGLPPPDSTLDEGAIFCVWRSASGLLVTCGNHGWSAKWHAVAAGRLAAFLFEARASNVGPAQHSDWLRIYRQGHHRPRPHDVMPRLDLLVRKDRRDRRR